jgi:hypothetical protein
MKKFLRQFSFFEIFIIFSVLAIHIYAATADAYAFPNAWFKRDDAYYYFKVAQNISEGYGSTFDKINLSNGYHPLWTIVCIPIFALARFDLILPLRILLIVIALMQISTSILLYRLIKKQLSHAIAILVATFWSFNPYIHASVYQMGLETPIAALSIVFLIYKLSQLEEQWRKEKPTLKQIAFLGFISALVMFSRLDLVFLAILVGIWVLFRGNTTRYLLPFDILIIFASMTSSAILRTGFDTYNITYASSAVVLSILAIIIKTLSLYFFSAYQHPRTKSIWKNILQVFYASAISSGLIFLIYILLTQIGIGQNFPRSTFGLDFGISFILFSTLRLTAYLFAQPKISKPETPIAQLQSNWKKWFNEGFAFYGVLGGLLIFYMLFNHFTFGTSSPVSGQIKRWWGSMASSAYEKPPSNWNAYLGIDQNRLDAWLPFTDGIRLSSNLLRPVLPYIEYQDERFYLTIFILIFGTCLIYYQNKKQILRKITLLGFIPLLAGCMLQLLSYTATGYSGMHEWYWITQKIFLILFFSHLATFIVNFLEKIKSLRIGIEITCILLSLFSAYQLWSVIQFTMPHNVFPADRPYMEVVKYLEDNTPPNSIIGMTGGGNVGYFIKDRTIVNMDGLINSYEYFKILQAGEAPLYLRERGMLILFANPRLLSIPPYFGQFAPYLERYNSYGGKDLLYLLAEPKY